MDGERFDDLTRGLATGGTTRRMLLRNLGGTVAGAALAGLGVRPALASRKGGPKGNNGPNGPNGNNGPNGPLGNNNPGNNNPSGGVCDNCDSVCSNCPIACCLA